MSADPLMNHPDQLKNLIQFQEGSVVSRVLLKQKNGNVTLFAFGKGEELTEHTSPFGALVYGVEGEGEIKIAGEPNPLHPGDILSLPPDIPHAVRAVSDFKMLLVMIRG